VRDQLFIVWVVYLDSHNRDLSVLIMCGAAYLLLCEKVMQYLFIGRCKRLGLHNVFIEAKLFFSHNNVFFAKK
jgi:hypothetical protein